MEKTEHFHTSKYHVLNLIFVTESCNGYSLQTLILQHYVIKFVSDLRHVGGLLRVVRYPLPITP